MIPEQFPFDKKWYSHKFHGPGLRYELAVSIFGGDIVWVNGPFPCGDFNDIAIFFLGLKEKLNVNEMAEADSRYRGEPSTIRTKADYNSRKEKAEKDKVRARHETMNSRLKSFGVLSRRYRHDLKEHGKVFCAVVALVQLGINSGETLFACDFETERKQNYLSVHACSK
jgi:hypothetical protein